MKAEPNQSGFTLPELLVAITLTGFMSSLILFFAFSFWRSAATAQADLESMVERMNASDFIREYVGTSSGLIIQNSIPDQYPGAPDTTITPENYWIPIHATPQTIDGSGTGIAPVLYFRRPSINTSNNIAMNGTIPYEDEFVIYLDKSSKKLRLRTLANPSVTNNKARTSCPDSSASASCPADKELVNDISTVSLRYFSRSGNTMDYQSSTDPTSGAYNGPDYPSVEVVEITFNVSRRALFQKVDSTVNSTIVRIALRNT